MVIFIVEMESRPPGNPRLNIFIHLQKRAKNMSLFWMEALEKRMVKDHGLTSM